MIPPRGNRNPVLWRLRPAERRFILIFGDLFSSCMAMIFALYYWSQQDAWLGFSLEFFQVRIPFWYYLLPFLWLILMVELYDIKRANRRSETLQGITVSAIIGFILYSIIYFASEPNSLNRIGVAGFIVLSFIFTIFWRLIYLQVFTTPLFMRRVLVVGAGRAGSTLVKIIHSIWPPPFYLVGLIDDDTRKIGKKIDNYPIIGGCNELLQIIEKENVTDLVFSISGVMKPEMLQSLLSAEERGVVVTTMPTMYEELMGRVPINLLESDWILRSFVDQIHTSEFYELAKRIMDIIGGFFGVLFVIAITPIISLSILIDSGIPIFYSQDRLGKNGKIYKIIKFRTMRQDAEKDGIARPATENDKRVTRIGRLLRKSHLDEIPQFINVFQGQISLVGPRAERLELVEELQSQVPFYRARLFVKPGLTGYAQVNYGYASTVEETAIKLEYDLYYIKHRNLLMDLIILLRTAGTVFGLRGQ